MSTMNQIPARKRLFPAYTLDELKSWIGLDDETAKKVAEEIEAREAGSVARITPQIEGGRVISRIGRM